MPRVLSPSRQALSDMHRANKSTRGRRGFRAKSSEVIEPHVVSHAQKVMAALAVQTSIRNPKLSMKKIIRDLGASGKAVETILELSRQMREAYERSRKSV